MSSKYLVAEIKIEEREGCFHAHSSDVPGFHLCGDSVDALHHDIPGALEFLFKVKHNLTIEVQRASSPAALGPTGIVDQRRTPRPAQPERFVMTQAFAYA